MNLATINRIYNINGCLQAIKNIPNTNSTSGTLLYFNGDINRETNTNKSFGVQIFVAYPYPQKVNITFIRSNWGGTWQQWDRIPSDGYGVIPNYANFSAFKRFGTIGDSLSTGTYSNEAGETVEDLSKSWGSHIANKCNNECLTLGFGGATTTRWIDGVSWHENNLAKALLPENECDAYILCMGYNDNNTSSSSGGVPLGSMADIDATNPDNNAVSYYGNIDKICRKLYTAFPKTKIFVLNNPYYNTAVAESYNTALKEVCNRLNGNPVYLIDMYSRYNGIYQNFVNDREGNHYHPQVYQYMGMLIATAISDYMRDNYTSFKYIENEHINTYKEPQYELLNTVEIEQANTAVVDIALSVDKFILYIKAPAATANLSCGVQVSKNSEIVGYCWLNNMIGTVARRCTIFGRNENGLSYIEHTTPQNLTDTIESAAALSRQSRYADAAPYDRIRIFGSGSNAMPIGTVFELWGVKA